LSGFGDREGTRKSSEPRDTGGAVQWLSRDAADALGKISAIAHGAQEPSAAMQRIGERRVPRVVHILFAAALFLHISTMDTVVKSGQAG
jgi:hypothetical protein